MSNPQELTRYVLDQVSGDGRMNVLLDRPDLAQGQTLDLKEMPDVIWKVVERHETLAVRAIRRGWNNNI